MVQSKLELQKRNQFYRDMQRLNLGKNKLTAIPHEALVSLTYLETLELSGNQISNLSPGDFNGEFLYHKSFP